MTDLTRWARALFSVIRSKAPCILLFDEFEGIFGKGISKDRNVAGLCSAIKSEWGLLINNKCPVIVYATTDSPWEMENDPGLFRRFRTQNHMGLPNRSTVHTLVQRFFKDEPNTLTASNFKRIATWLHGGSNDDIVKFLDKIIGDQTVLAVKANNWEEVSS